MPRRNFLFERLDLNEQIGDRRTSAMLFTKSQFGRVELCNVSRNLFSQFNLFNKDSFESSANDSSFFKTPPMEIKTVAAPRAPVKNKKQLKKVDLKPKRLQYTEEDLDISNTLDRVTINCPSNTLSRKQTWKKIQCDESDATQEQMRTLHSRVDKIKLQANDKENDMNIVGNRSESTLNNRNDIVRVSSVVSSSNTIVESENHSYLDWKQRLYWLQSQREVGIWVECCKTSCKKWRYIEDCHDPLDIPKIWYCKMNSDESMASCDIAEASKPLPLIENDYNAGSIVWARVPRYPWWPGIICDSVDTFMYYKKRRYSLKPHQYHVTFFNKDKLEWDWIHIRNLKPFVAYNYSQLITKTVFKGVDYKDSLMEAYELASSALPLRIAERLQKFDFITQYDRFYNDYTNNNLNNSVDRNAQRLGDTIQHNPSTRNCRTLRKRKIQTS
ncbi:uncharacterized protein LOC128886689 [Hylaeus anthracinus]|uniref:uncharacterized protein LOC128886689 n=1 Tax=Hylaeus anthracinus TaxID=313031 RepID=UPI0023B8B7A9|nr:uncharacterized protein LOC128886689 [Hylaeus anthracinus]